MAMNLQAFIIGIVIVGITLVIGIYVSNTIGDQMPAGSTAQNAAVDVTDALAGGTPWITILVVVGFSVIVLAMLSEGLGSAASSAGGNVY